ncbi:MAG: hypothetical protein ACFE0O_07025 [Opitutales bacterium]
MHSILISGRLRRLLPVCLTALLATLPVSAQTRTLSLRGTEAFEAADLEGLSIDQDGIIRPATALGEGILLPESLVWDALFGPDGHLFLATGPQGTVHRLKPGEPAETVFTPEEVFVRSLAFGADGQLYVGVGPGARVYRVSPDPQAGQDPVSVVLDAAGTYVWDMRFGPEGRHLFVATGSPAAVYRVDTEQPAARSRPEPFFQPGQDHAYALAHEADGSLLVGTGPGGYVFRVDPDGSARALFDLPADEIAGILPRPDGSAWVGVYAAGSSNGGRGESSAPSPGGIGLPSPTAEGAGSAPSGSSADAARNGSGGALYAIDPSGFAERFWVAPGEGLYGMEATPEGDVLVGVGREGRIYRVGGRDDWSLLQTLPAGGAVTAWATDEAGATWAFSSNPARLYQLTSGGKVTGRLTSEPLDAGQPVEWGALHVKTLAGPAPQNGLALETRSGNTPEPDDTWTVFSPLSEDGRIRSPVGRYLQLRADWATDGPAVRSFDAFYRLPNQAPVVRKIRAVPALLEPRPNTANRNSVPLKKLLEEADPRTALADPKPSPQLQILREDGAMTLVWEVIDPNGDRLRYDLDLRGPGLDSAWLPVARDLDTPLFGFTLNGLADGFYQARVSATDARDQPESEALTGVGQSSPFLIDGTPPSLTTRLDNSGEEPVLVIETRDAFGVVTYLHAIVDGAKPVRLLPEDGLHDQLTETFRLPVEGVSSVLLEAYDQNGNAGLLTWRAP